MMPKPVPLTKHDLKVTGLYWKKLKGWGRICYFIYGNEASGTRLVQRVIGSDPTVYDDGVPGFMGRQGTRNWRNMNQHRIVFKRDDGWQPQIDLSEISDDMRMAGWNIYWIFTIRRPSRYEMMGRPQKLNEYFLAVKPQDLYVIWDNSLFFIDTKRYLREMGILLNLDFSGFKEKIYNSDVKWMRHYKVMEEQN